MKCKIGVFDSGIGGITVLKEIIKVLLNEEYIYYSDSKNNPYGDKEDKQIIEIADNIIKQLIKMKCNVIIIACNTASAKAASYLRKKYIDIIFIAIEPAYKMVYDNSFDKETLIMATKGTLESEKFILLFEKYNNNKTIIVPCEGLADTIEKGSKIEILNNLEKNIGQYKGKVQNVVLGCTHYPLIKNEIIDKLGEVIFFEGSKKIAVYLKSILEDKKLVNNSKLYQKNLLRNRINFIDSSNSTSKKERFFMLLES